MYKAIDIYLEKRKTRKYVGRLQQKKRQFVFQYDEAYLYMDNPIPLGPDLPLNRRKHTSLKLFPSFADRIPSKQNPSYKEYCDSVGIKPSETNPLVLLATLGKKGPSSFICVPVKEEQIFSNEQLKRFRKKLKLSIREFSDLFDVSSATIYRIENNKTSGKDALKRIGVYYRSPQTALDKIKTTGVKINTDKRQFVENFFKSQIKRSNIAVGPFTVTIDHINNCDEKQIVELIKRLSLFECNQYNIPQNSVHFSGNIPAKDGGQDGLVKWSQGPSYTNYFPNRYNCFQIKKGSVTPSECKKEICDENQNLKPAVQNVIKNKGAYILCSTYPVSGVYLKAREEALQEEIRSKGYDPDLIRIKFYDANIIVDWVNNFYPLAIWFLKEVCNRTIGPWISWQDWSREDSDYKSEFMYNSDLENKKKYIYKTLSKPRRVAHLAGVSGVGKTRLTLEAFRPTEQFDLSYLVLYSSAENLEDSHIRELKSFRTILIIDDCPVEKAEKFYKIALQEDSKLSVLTIGQEEQLISNDIQIIKLNPDEEIVKKILSDSQDITNKHVDSKWLLLTSGFPLMAKLLKDSGPLDLLKDDIPTVRRKKMLWGMNQPDSIGESVIKACSLFNTVCVSDDDWKKRGWVASSTAFNRGKEEARYIAEKICRIDYDKFYAKIQHFKKKKIIQQSGRFIQVRPKPLAVWLATELIKDTHLESVIKWLTGMSTYQVPDEYSSEDQNLSDQKYQELSDIKKRKPEQRRSTQFVLNGLRESFCKQFSFFSNLSSENQELAQQLCEVEGLFGKKEVLTTHWGSTCFYHLAEITPKTALKTLKNIIENHTVEELLNISKSKKNLVLVLQKLAVRKELYQDSARLLLKFAETENEYHNGQSINNNATDIFIHHFQILLSGTEAEPNMKFKIINKIEQSNSIKQKEIAIKALKEALPKQSTIGFSDSIMQTVRGEQFQDWRPKTDEEYWDYFRKALEYLVKFATKASNQKIQDSAKEVIAQNLSSLLTINHLHDDVDKAVKDVTLIHDTYWPEAIHNLMWFINHNKKTTKENIKKAKEILKLLQPKTKDINKRLKLYVKEDSDLYDLKESKKKNTPHKYNEHFEVLVKDFKNYLESEDESKIVPLFYLLLHGKQSNTIPFAREISQKLKKPLKLTSLLLDLVKEWKEHTDFNPSFLSGFLDGLNKKNPNTVQKILENISNDNHLADLILPAYWSLKLQDRDIKRLTEVINNKSVKINASELKYLSTTQKCQSVSVTVMKKLISILTDKNTEFSWSALHIYSYYVHSKPERKQELLHVLYKLLTKEELLTQYKSRYDNMSSYIYEEAVSDILNSDYGEQFSKIFTSEILNSKLSLFDFPINNYTIKECFKEMLEKYPDAVLSEVMKCDISNLNTQSIFEDILGSINSLGGSWNIYNTNTSPILTEQKLKKWCEKAPDKIPVFIAKNIDLFTYDDTKKRYTWSSFSLFLFNEYGDKKNVTEAIAMNVHNFSWIGSVLKYFEQIKTAIEELQNHKHKNVCEFCEKEIEFLEERIKREKQMQKEREEFGV